MPREFDPVDRALDTLRSDAWTPASTNQELEDKLMQKFSHSNSGFKMRSHPLVMVAAVLLVGGVTFAGVAQLRSWLVEVDVNGQKTYVEIGENDRQTMTFETEDGGTATVQISQDSSEGEDTTTVRLQVDNDDSVEEEVAVAKRRVMQDGAAQEFGIEILGDAQAAHAWDTDEASNELYLIESKDGSSMDLYLATTEKGAETVVRLVASPPASMFDGAEPRFRVDGPALTMTLDDGNGREAVLKFLVATSMDEIGDLGNRDMNVGTPDGEIRVRVSVPDDN